MRIKPASGLKVRDHLTRQLLPAEGIDVADVEGVPVHPYWHRLLRDQDVVVDEPPQEAAPLSAALAEENNPDAAPAAHGS